MNAPRLIASWAAALLLAALAGCSGAPSEARVAPQKADVARPQGGCAQSEWQAQTAPVIGKRQGNEALGTYDNDELTQESGCR